MHTAEAETEVPASIAGCIEACDRCTAVADGITVEQYRHAPPGRSSIGAHLRHALEHVVCLIDGVEAGVVDYDARARDAALEQDPDAARAAITRLNDRLRGLDPGRLHAPLAVRESAASDQPAAETPSTLARELTFVSGHIIHHLEIAGLVAELQGIDLPLEWGVAFSTAAYRAGQ